MNNMKQMDLSPAICLARWHGAIGWANCQPLAVAGEGLAYAELRSDARGAGSSASVELVVWMGDFRLPSARTKPRIQGHLIGWGNHGTTRICPKSKHAMSKYHVRKVLNQNGKSSQAAAKRAKSAPSLAWPYDHASNH